MADSLIKQDILSDVISRLQSTVYPLIHDKLASDITSMLGFQLDRLPAMTQMQRAMLVDRIVARFKGAMMPLHEPVGTLGSQTIAENQVQSSLSSHHHAGLRRGAVGFERIEQLTNLADTGLCKLVTTPIGGTSVPRSEGDIYRLANTMVNILLMDISKGYRVMEGEHPIWYPLLLRIMGKSDEVIQSTWMRIDIDPYLMYKHRISLPVIAGALNDAIEGIGIILYPPASEGTYIDIHIRADASKSAKLRRLGQLLAVQVGGIASVETAYTLFENLLDGLVIREVGDHIYEVTGTAPDFVPEFVWEYMISSMVPDAQHIPNYGGRRFQSALTRDRIYHQMIETPLKYNDVLDQIQHLDGDGIIVPPDSEDIAMYRVTFQQDVVSEFPYLEYADLSPHEFRTKEDMENFLLDIMVDRHLFWYIEAVCHSVKDIFVLPEIDATRSYTTSPIDCKDTLGYLVMRQMLYDEIRANIKVDPLWLKVLVNNMTVYKMPVAIRRQSIRHDRSEWLTYTTFEDVLKWITYAAFTGEVDHMNSISSHVLSGRQIEVGRGGARLNKGNEFLRLKARTTK